MTDDDLDLEHRLRRLGDVPLDPRTANAHRAAMAELAARPDSRQRRFGWKAVAAAAFAGFLAGSTGLAAAGALPDPAQDAAHDVLDAVGIDVPRSTDGCPEGTTYRNHGEYVASVEAAGGDVEAAAHSDCGKPSRGNGNGNGNGSGKRSSSAGEPRADTDGDPCTGPPPWAGTNLAPDDREAARAERQAACGTDDDDVEEPRAQADDDADLGEPPEAPEQTTTTEAAETTTSTVPDSTSTTAGS